MSIAEPSPLHSPPLRATALAVVLGTSLLAACSVEPVTFTPGEPPPVEVCAVLGDEGGNGQADCADAALRRGLRARSLREVLT